MNDVQGHALAEQLAGLTSAADRASRALLATDPSMQGCSLEARSALLARGHQLLDQLAGSLRARHPLLLAAYLDWARRCCPDGLPASPEVHARLLAEQLGAHLSDVDRDELSRHVSSAIALCDDPPLSVGDDPRAPTRLAYLAAALAGDRPRATAIVDEALASGFSLREAYECILIEAQRALGRLWDTTSITVAREHLASSVTQSVMGALYTRIPRLSTPLGIALVAGVEQELHSLPAHFVADLLELHGWRAACPGTNVPTRDLLSLIDQLQPDLVGLSTSLSENVTATVALVREIKAHAPQQRIVLGGRAVWPYPHLGPELGVEVIVGSSLASLV